MLLLKVHKGRLICGYLHIWLSKIFIFRILYYFCSGPVCSVKYTPPTWTTENCGYGLMHTYLGSEEWRIAVMFR